MLHSRIQEGKRRLSKQIFGDLNELKKSEREKEIQAQYMDEEH